MAKRVTLGPKLDTAASAALFAELKELEDEDVVLDASGVDLVGARCLDVIMGAAAHWKKQGRALTIENPSEQTIENLGRFGMTPETLVEGAA